MATPGSHNSTATSTSELSNEYNGEDLRAIAILFIALVTIFIILRFYARRMGRVTWGLDDSLIIPGAIFCLALCTSALGMLYTSFPLGYLSDQD